MKLETIKLEALIPLEKNVRKHNDKQIEELIKSIKQFGQTRAIVIDEQNNILIGNGLYIALTKMGEEKCQCYRMAGLTDIQKKKLILTDNKIYSLGTDDYTMIVDYVQEITDAGDFDIAGFDSFVIENMIISDEQTNNEIYNAGIITEEKYVTPAAPVESMPEHSTNEIEESEPTTIVTETVVGAKQERKYVVCKNCGEVIYLD